MRRLAFYGLAFGGILASSMAAYVAIHDSGSKFEALEDLRKQVNEIEHYSKMSKLELLKLQQGIVLNFETLSDYERKIEDLLGSIRNSSVLRSDADGIYFQLESFIASRLAENTNIDRFKSVSALRRNAEINFNERSRALLLEFAKRQWLDNAATGWIRRYVAIGESVLSGQTAEEPPGNRGQDDAYGDAASDWNKAAPMAEALAHGHQLIVMTDQLGRIVNETFSDYYKDDYLYLLNTIDTQLKVQGDRLRVRKIYFTSSIALLCVLVIVAIGMLVHALQQLRETKAELEQRVDVRTQELSTKSDELERYRDHLEEQVNERTKQLHLKAQELVTALIKEQQYSKLQKDFVSMISHEFRTPVAIIDMAAQRILRKKTAAVEPEALEEFAKGVRKNTRRLTGLIDRTLTSSKFREGRLEFASAKLDLTKLLTDVCAQQERLGSDNAIHTRVDPDIPEITGDPQMLEQVFTNLIGNAVKYSPEKTPVVVRVRREGDFVRVEVIDQGIGIPEKELPKLFERYFRASNARVIAGTGLGLAITKEMVELHGGTLRVTTGENQGSAFFVTLPVSGPQIEAAAAESEQSGAA